MSSSQKSFYDDQWRKNGSNDPRGTRLFLERLALLRRLVSESLREMGCHSPTVLELGCGVGGIANWLAEQGVDVTAIDVSPEAIRIAEERASGLPRPPKFLCLDACDLKWKGPSVDLVIAFDVIEHIEPRVLPHAFGVVSTMLSRGGRFLLTTPNRARLGNRVRGCLRRPLSLYPVHEREYRAEELVELLTEAGLSVIGLRGHFLISADYTHGLPIIHRLSFLLGRAMPRWASWLLVVTQKP